VTLRRVAALLVLGLPGPAALAGVLDTGAVQVRLAAPSPAPAPAAAPAVARLRALDFAWSAEVEASGLRAAFPAVPPGRYELTVELAGAAPARVPVRVAAGTLIVLEGTLAAEASALRETGLETPAAGTVFGEDWLRDLPTGRDPWSLLETAEIAAVTDRMDTGGVWAGLPGRVSAHGTSLTQAAFHLAGTDASDPLGSGRSLFDPDLLWLSSLHFATGLLPAGVAGAGPVLVATPQRPGQTWQGSLTADFAHPETGPSGAPPPIARLDHWSSGALLARGPLGDRIGLVVAASVRDASRLERDDPRELPSRVLSGMGQVVFTPSAAQEVRLLLAGQDTDRPFESRAAAIEPGTTEHAGAVIVEGEWHGRRRDGAAASVRAGYTRGTTDSTGADLGGTVERLRDGPVPQLVLPGRAVRSRLSAEGQADLPGRLFGAGGALQLGLGAFRESAETTPVPGLWRTPQRLDGVGAQVWETEVGRTAPRWASTELAAWVEGRTDPARRLTLRAGARLEWLAASAETAAPEVSWLTVTPRLRASWRLGGGLALVIGFGQYRHRLPLSTLAFGDPAAPTAAIYRWNDRNVDGEFALPERGPLVARYGPGAPVAALDAGLRAPRTSEVVFGVEHRRGPWTARLLGLYRRERDLLETVNLGVTAADYVVSTVPDPGGDIHGAADDQLLPIYARRPSSFGADEFLLTNVADDDAWHEGAEITLARDGERFGFVLGATAHRADGPNAWRGFRPSENDQGFVGERRDQPNADTFGRGRLFADRAYTIKVASRYAAPGDLRLGLVARYQDGQPFARIVLAPGLPQGTEMVQAVPNGRHRFEFALTLDARLEKGFTFGRARLAVVAEAFNLLANAHEVEEDPVSGPTFRTPTANQPPRVFRFGLRVDLR
jgi:hypothetical protein